MEKILTIVIPTYNMQDYLHRCLDSLIVSEEQLAKLEVLVVNDGSKDNSSAIAHEYQDKYPVTFRVIDKENGNYGSCVNRGLKEATGKYIKILDADDNFETKAFDKYIDFLSKTDADLIVNDYCTINENGAITGVVHYNLSKNVSTFDETVRKKFNQKNFQMHAAAYKVNNLRLLGYKQTEGISYTDQEWIYTPLMVVQTIAYFKGTVYKYLLGRSGQTMSPEALKKGVRQNQTCVIRILKDYVGMPSTLNTAVVNYLKDQMLVSLHSIYMSYLLQYRDLDLNGLVSFEEELNGFINSAIEKQIDSMTIPGTFYPYVRYWHTHGQRPKSMWFFMNKFYSRIYGKVLREMHKYL